VPASRQGLALTVGVNFVSPAHYRPLPARLRGCEPDARDMAGIARSQGFKVLTLENERATRKELSRHIAWAAARLAPGDIFLLTFSGHGSRLRDRPGGDEPDGFDETWCLYDGQILDDELYQLWKRFAPGVRLLVFADSCHSGTSAKFIEFARSVESTPQALWTADAAAQERITADLKSKTAAIDPATITKAASPANPNKAELGVLESPVRAMPDEIAEAVETNNQEFYDRIKAAADAASPAGDRGLDEVQASGLLISGCQDNQLSADLATNGLFTEAVKVAWAAGGFPPGRSYRDFHARIQSMMPARQSPNFFTFGVPNPAFLSQRPFSI
jgi:hypothetical protein